MRSILIDGQKFQMNDDQTEIFHLGQWKTIHYEKDRGQFIESEEGQGNIYLDELNQAAKKTNEALRWSESLSAGQIEFKWLRAFGFAVDANRLTTQNIEKLYIHICYQKENGGSEVCDAADVIPVQESPPCTNFARKSILAIRQKWAKRLSIMKHNLVADESAMSGAEKDMLEQTIRNTAEMINDFCPISNAQQIQAILFNKDFVDEAINAYFHQTGNELQRKGIGIIEKRNLEATKRKCKLYFEIMESSSMQSPVNAILNVLRGYKAAASSGVLPTLILFQKDTQALQTLLEQTDKLIEVLS